MVVPEELLLARLREVMEQRRKLAVELDGLYRRGVELVGELRDRGVGYRVIRERGDLPMGTAHKWREQYEQGRTVRSAGGEDEGR